MIRTQVDACTIHFDLEPRSGSRSGPVYTGVYSDRMSETIIVKIIDWRKHIRILGECHNKTAGTINETRSLQTFSTLYCINTCCMKAVRAELVEW